MMLMECPGKPGKARGKVEKSKRKFPVALPCRRLANITASTPEDRAAAEIARCLHEVTFCEIPFKMFYYLIA